MPDLHLYKNIINHNLMIFKIFKNLENCEVDNVCRSTICKYVLFATCDSTSYERNHSPQFFLQNYKNYKVKVPYEHKYGTITESKHIFLFKHIYDNIMAFRPEILGIIETKTILLGLHITIKLENVSKYLKCYPNKFVICFWKSSIFLTAKYYIF